jgi:uncharacterized membrane protein YhaH (DUF805 family)
MSGQGDLGELFLSSAGRLARLPFLVAAMALIAITALYQRLVGDRLHGLTGWLVYPPLLFCAACVLCKRLHDRGRSGWWAGLVLLAFVVVWPRPHGVLALPFLLVLAGAIVELGVMPGEPGANRYGADPRRPATA